MVYVHIGCVLILPESMSQSLYCRRHMRRQYRNVSWTQGVLAHNQCEHIHHVLCDPYLVSFPFYTIPICLFLKIHRIFYLLVSSHFYIHSVYILSVSG